METPLEQTHWGHMASYKAGAQQRGGRSVTAILTLLNESNFRTCRLGIGDNKVLKFREERVYIKGGLNENGNVHNNKRVK